MKPDDSSNADRAAARGTNDRFRDAPPVGTVTPATTVERHIVFTSEPCPCSCRSHCEACTPDTGDAA